MTQLRHTLALPIPVDDSSMSFFDLSPTPAWIDDEELRRLVAVNDGALEEYGYADREQFLALTLEELLPAEPFQRPNWEPGRPSRATLRRGDGSSVAVELRAKRVEFRHRPAWLVTATDIGDRIRLEQELAQSRGSEDRFRQLSEAASDWFWEADAKGYLTYLSPKCEAISGHPIATMLGKRLNDLPGVTIAPAVAEKARAAIRARETCYDYIYSILSPSGDKKLWVQTNSIPVIGQNGELLGFRGASRDITKQIEAEQALRESQQRFRRLFEIGSDYYWEDDADHRLSYVSPAAVHDAIYGVPLSELLGTRPTETLAVRFDPAAGERALQAMKAREPYRDLVFSVKHADGALRWVSASGAPRFGKDGEFLGYHGSGVDITQRKEAEAAAQLAQGRLHDAVAHVTQPFVVFDAGDRAVAFNQAFTELFRTPTRNPPIYQGIPIRELAEWQVRMDCYADGPDDGPVDVERLLAQYQTMDEHTCHLRDGRWMLVIYRRLPGGRVGSWTDVTAIKRAETERRDLEAQLHHSQRLQALGTLAGGVAHELNNALVPVVALTKIVARKLPVGSRERRNLDTVVDAAQRSRDLVEKILAFSRKEGEPRRERIDLARVLRQALGLMRATVPTSIGFTEMIVPTRPLAGDPGQIHQVIVNLVTNAAQAIGPATGTIRVRLEPVANGTHLRLSVSDTGCGMDEATKARIFEPFFTTKPVGEGTGLGLSVVHGIVKSHGGTIGVESTPGEGTRFDITLPVASDEAG